MIDDLHQGIRRLRRAPGFVVAAVSTLALSIGIATAAFSAVDAVLFQRLPISTPEAVVVIWPRERANPASIGEISYAVFRTWQRDAQSFDGLAAMGSVNWSLILREGEATTVPVAGVSASFFPLMGTAPMLGRTLLPDDDRRGSAPAAVMSHRLWATRFGSDPAIVGRTLTFQDGLYAIVGVMPDGFDYPRGVDLWVPVVPRLAASDAQWGINSLEDRYWGVLHLVGRLRPGTSANAARDELTAFIAREQGSFRPDSEAVVTPLTEHIFGATRPALLALGVSVALALLIGCANVAVLLLIRADGAGHETATRLAMGASRWRIVRHSLLEALLLTAGGSIGGVTLAYWALPLLIAMAPADTPRLDAIGIDGRALLFAVSACALATLMTGLVPGLKAMRWTNLARPMAGGGRLTRAGRLRRIFVVTQVMLALMLLMCAGLVGRSFANLRHIDIGFEPTDVLTLNAGVPDAQPVRVNAFYTALLERVRAMPGVLKAGAVSQRPLELRGVGTDAMILLEGQRQDPQFREWERNPAVSLEVVTPGYFEAMGMRLVKGRTFTDADDARAPLVVVVGESLARRLWPGEDPIGKRVFSPGSIGTGVELGLDAQRPSTVVGVVRDARSRGLTDPRFDFYLPYLQSDMNVQHLMVHTTAEPVSLASAIRAAALRAEPNALVEGVTTMEAIVNRTTAPWRFSTATLALVGALAIGLSMLGLYTAVSQSVVERTREIGVRVSVGARPGDVARLVLSEGARLAGIGLVLGLAGAIGITRTSTGLLYGVEAWDPLTLAGTIVLFAVTALFALAVPSWRAARIDPVGALRS